MNETNSECENNYEKDCSTVCHQFYHTVLTIVSVISECLTMSARLKPFNLYTNRNQGLRKVWDGATEKGPRQAR